ncbi:MAG TPA: hypothetical protein PK336_08925 [Methanoculleus sp.]|nr:hypothetical protein [Methanoculleus sp.]
MKLDAVTEQTSEEAGEIESVKDLPNNVPRRRRIPEICLGIGLAGELPRLRDGASCFIPFY